MPAEPLSRASRHCRSLGEDRPVFDEASQIVGHVFGRRVTIGRRFGRRVEHDGFQFRRDGLVHVPRRNRLSARPIPQQLLPVVAGEDRFERQQLVQRCPEGINVAAVIDQPLLAQGLLGAHVPQRAQKIAGDGQTGVGLEAGQTEVGDPQLAVGVEHQVRRLDVPMYDPSLMGELQRLGRLHRQLGNRSEIGRVVGQRSFGGKVSNRPGLRGADVRPWSCRPTSG